jgi:uncharacterized sulfatase
LTPTLAAAAGASLPEGVAIDGIDLLDPKAIRPDDALFWQSGYYLAVRQGDWKLQINKKQKKSWLFNLATDPTEKVNLADKEPAKVAALTALLEAHRKNARAPLWPYTTEQPKAVDKTVGESFLPGDEYVYWPN